LEHALQAAYLASTDKLLIELSQAKEPIQMPIVELDESKYEIMDAITQTEKHALANPTSIDRDTVIVAALLHDLGHICVKAGVPQMDTDGGPNVGVVNHEKIGADCCRDLGFSEEVVQLVESHVTSKRYLTHIEPIYLSKLASDSTRSLKFQGGPMTAEEARAFEQQEVGLCWKIKMRHWDDLAKTSGRVVPEFQYYRDLIVRVLKRNSAKFASQ
jgi:putative nucleotidyltransferase with HDIG domain